MSSTTCSVCGQVCHSSELIDFEGQAVCANCKPSYVQSVREGVHPRKIRYTGRRRRPVGGAAGAAITYRPYPALTTVMMIIDIVFCSLGAILLVGMMLLGGVFLKDVLDNGSGMVVGILAIAIIIGGGYLGLAILADVLVLKKKKAGLVLGWILVSLSLGIGLLGGVASLATGDVKSLGKLIIKIPYCVLYMVALVHAGRWMRENRDW